MKAHGVPWLIHHHAGDMPLATAAEEAKKDTRHYAKSSSPDSGISSATGRKPNRPALMIC
jgi:Cu/Zn superoxide dismutase